MDQSTKMLAGFNVAIIVVLAITTFASNWTLIGREHASTNGTVTRTTPDDHSTVFSDYSADGRSFHIRESADCRKYGPGDSIAIYYATDDPAVSTYEEHRFSLSSSIGFVVFASIFFTAFIWTLGRKVLGAVRRLRGHGPAPDINFETHR